MFNYSKIVVESFGLGIVIFIVNVIDVDFLVGIVVIEMDYFVLYISICICIIYKWYYIVFYIKFYIDILVFI